MSGKPKYRSIYEQLRERILSLPEGERLDSVRELRKNCGVSLATINSALKLLTEEGLVVSVHKQGIFRAGDSARTLRRPVILILPGRDEPLFRRIIFSCYEALEKRNMRLQFMIHKLEPNAELETVNRAFREEPAGILYMPTLVSDELKQALRDGCGRVPLVQLNRETGTAEISFVGTRVYEASFAATTRLIEHGHRRIGIIMQKNNDSMPDQQERIAGFQAALKQGGLCWRNAYEIIFDPVDRRLASDVIELLSRRDRPTAFFATNSAYLPAFFRKADFCGLRIPDDLSITGVDIAEMFRELPVAVERFEQPLAEICSRAVEILYRMIVSRDFRPCRELLDGVPSAGNSCGSPPVQDDMEPFARSNSYFPKQWKGNENADQNNPREKCSFHTY